MHPMLNTAVRAARSAGDLIVRSQERQDEIPVDTKGRHDFVTSVDREGVADGVPARLETPAP